MSVNSIMTHELRPINENHYPAQKKCKSNCRISKDIPQKIGIAIGVISLVALIIFFALPVVVPTVISATIIVASIAGMLAGISLYASSRLGCCKKKNTEQQIPEAARNRTHIPANTQPINQQVQTIPANLPAADPVKSVESQLDELMTRYRTALQNPDQSDEPNALSELQKNLDQFKRTLAREGYAGQQKALEKLTKFYQEIEEERHQDAQIFRNKFGTHLTKFALENEDIKETKKRLKELEVELEQGRESSKGNEPNENEKNILLRIKQQQDKINQAKKSLSTINPDQMAQMKMLYPDLIKLYEQHIEERKRLLADL